MGSCRGFIIRTCGGVALLLISLILACSKNEVPGNLATPTPTPIPQLTRKPYETARLFNGIILKSSIQSTPSDFTALNLEEDSDSYTLQLELHLKIPSPATTATNLLAATPELATLLPNLTDLLADATVSPDFATLFANKEKNLRANLGSLQRLIPLDTLYDCQTILNLQEPVTSRHALLIQALMNVNADGSDGDRNLAPNKSSEFFQPQTNYRWPKETDHPNPCLHDMELRLAETKKKLADEGLSTKEKSTLLAAESDEKDTLEELKRWSFLVGTADPFIVLPSFMFGGAEGHPQIGDYAIIIASDTLYPAILGDKGPNYKIGEASLRLCKEIDDKSTADIRPVDHPTVTYLIFPGTAEKPFAKPDYKHWSDRCHALWKEMGGSEAAIWQEWESLEKPWPTPTPTPTPSPSETPSLLPDGMPGITPLPSQPSNSSSGTNPASSSASAMPSVTNFPITNSPQ